MTHVFDPMSDKLICKPVEQDDISSGGIILPELDDLKTLKAEVIAAGKGFWAGVDLFINNTLIPGDIIVYQRFSAQVMEYEGVDYHVIQERDVLVKIKKS